MDMNKIILKKSFAAFMAAVLSVSGAAFPIERTGAAEDYGIETLAASNDSLRLPIEFIDYRADNLLFEYIMEYQNQTKYTDDLALTYSSITEGGGNLAYDTYGTAYSKNLVQNTLGENGLPIYSQEAVSYVAKLIQNDLNMNRNDSFTTDFYEALKANMYNPNGSGIKKYYFGEGDSSVVNWSVDTTSDNTEVWAPDGSNMKNTGAAGSMWYDFEVTQNTDWNLSFYHTGATFKYEAIVIDSGNEGQKLNTGTAAATGENQWVSVGFKINTGSATTVRIKITIEEGNEAIIGSGDGCFYSYGNHYNLGNYEESAAKEFNSLSDITTCFDYAYYMLNHYFDKDTIFGNYYGDLFSELELIADESGLGYNFLANFDTEHGVTEGTNYLPISYDSENKVIKNDSSITDIQKGFFPLSSDNAKNNVLLEASSAGAGAEGETGSNDDYTMTVLTTDGDSTYTLENSNYEYYLGSWNNSTAQAWVDSNDPDHIKVQNLSSLWYSEWGTQYYRTFTGLNGGETYTISVDIATGSTSTGDGKITTDFGHTNVDIPKNDVSTLTGTKVAGQDGSIKISFGMSYIGLGEIIDISHYVIEDASGNIVYESPSYSVEGEGTIPDAVGIHEAENALSFSDGYSRTSGSAFSGGKGIEGLNFNSSGEYKYLSFKVNADEAGTYVFKVVYSGGDTNTPNISVRVNQSTWLETKATDVTSRADPSGELLVKINLEAGENTIDVTGAHHSNYGNTSWQWVILDYFEISRSLETYANDITHTLGYRETTSNIGNTDNYHYAMKSSGKFIYEESENLFFNFTGDDDVYLFVNGKLALDIGGAHFAVNEVVNLNEMKDELGLVEGEIYSFDFFYLERHTDYSNLRINTNIKVMNSGATVLKTAYHNSYTGTVDDDEIQSATFSGVVSGENIEYALTVSNISSIPITDICFVDTMLSVNLEPVRGDYTISGMDGNEYFSLGNTLVAKIVWDDMENGVAVRKEVAATIDSMNKLNAVLKNNEQQLISLFGDTEISGSLMKLDNEVIGYKENTQITLGGFKYTVPENETIIVNEVEAAFYAYKDINFADQMEKQSAGVDDHITIIAIEYFAQDNADVTIELTDIINKVENINDSVMLQIQANVASSVTADGGNTTYGSVSVANEVVNYTPNGTAYNPVDDDFVYFTTIEENIDGNIVNTIVAIPVTVHLYDVNNDIYVLDYGIPVDLNANPSGIFANDEFDDNGWSKKKVVVDDNESTNDNYGTIDASNFADSFMELSEIENKTLKYTLDRFLEGIDERIYTVKIRKNDDSVNFDSEVTAEEGVDLTSNIKIMPGNVVYYEDNFVDIKRADGDIINGSADNTDKTQSNENNGPYGNDSSYGNEIGDSDGKSTVISTNAYYDSDGKYHSGTSDEVTFTFTGTGFDIIGRTNQTSPYVLVQYTDNGETKTKLVNACYTNGELYQVPVVSIRNLTNESHTVKILVAPAKTSGTEARSAKFYLDGIRIYNPSNDSEIINNYVIEERNAQFVNIHDMLVGNGEVFETIGEVNGEEVVVDASAEGRNALLVSVPANGNGIGKPLLLGYSNTEEITSTTTGLYTNSLTDYLAKGPNNEVYLSSGNAVAFVVDNFVENQSTIQIEAKRVRISNSGNGENVKLLSVYQENGIYKEYELATISTNTAMYYDIPVDKCISTASGYLVIIEGITTSEYCLSISNIKVTGCDLSCPTYGADGQIGIDPEKVVLPQFEFININVKNAYASKDATVEITVFADSDEDSVFDEDFDGRFDAYFDTASPGEEATSITYGFAGEEDVEAYWARVGSVKNADSTVTYIYRLKMPKDAQNMTLIISHTDDDYTYKIQKLVNVINPIE